MKSFYDTFHCRSEAHCTRCRSPQAGRPWRESIAASYVVADTDYECPRGHAWGYIAPVRKQGKSGIDTLLSRVESLAPAQDTSDRARMLRAVTAQLASLYGRLGGSCGCSAAKHRNRIINKIEYYITQYGATT